MLNVKFPYQISVFWFLLSPYFELIWSLLIYFSINHTCRKSYSKIYSKWLNAWTIGLKLSFDSFYISKANALTYSNERPCCTSLRYFLGFFVISNFRTAWITLESNGIWIQEMGHFMALRLVNKHGNTGLGGQEYKHNADKLYSVNIILFHRLILKSKMLLAGTINVLLSNLTSSYPFGLILLMLGEWLS